MGVKGHSALDGWSRSDHLFEHALTEERSHRDRKIGSPGLYVALSQIVLTPPSTPSRLNAMTTHQPGDMLT
jgi:hypothetical protein